MNEDLLNEAATLYAQCLEKAQELPLSDPADIARAANAMFTHVSSQIGSPPGRGGRGRF